MTAGENMSERDLLLSLMNGVGHEYDAVVVMISSQCQIMALEEAQFLFLMHEQRIEQLNTTSHINAHTAHFESNNNCYRRFDQQFQGLQVSPQGNQYAPVILVLIKETKQNLSTTKCTNFPSTGLQFRL
ncbi:hypothetical protein ACOSQ3_017024 [Xanthoceras sorbifolium]